MKQRLANIIYLAAIIAACFFVCVSPLAYLDLVDRFDRGHTIGVTLFVAIVLPVAIFVTGWTLRYIMIGTKGLKPEL